MPLIAKAATHNDKETPIQLIRMLRKERKVDSEITKMMETKAI